jgi:hypothetical protein
MSVGFNGGRIIAAFTILGLSGSMKASMELTTAVSYLGGFFLLGAIIILFLPETKGQELPE